MQQTLVFFQSMGIDIGIAREEDDVGNRYIPIKKITAANLHKQYSDSGGTSLQSGRR